MLNFFNPQKEYLPSERQNIKNQKWIEFYDHNLSNCIHTYTYKKKFNQNVYILELSDLDYIIKLSLLYHLFLR